MRSLWMLPALGLAVSGCLFEGKQEGIAGKWVYDFNPLLSSAWAYTRVVSFTDAGAVSFEHREFDAVAYGYSGTWTLRNDTLVIEKQTCTGPYLDSTSVVSTRPCSGPPEEDVRPYWDGKRIYDLNTGNGMKRHYERG